MLWSRPDHRRGAAKPASRIGRRGNMGSIAPYRIPTRREVIRGIAQAMAKELAWKRPISAVVAVTAPGKKPAANRLIGHQTPRPAGRPASDATTPMAPARGRPPLLPAAT